jgi:lipoprotein-anchoring transpeptidase ErfK/SrfK
MLHGWLGAGVATCALAYVVVSAQPISAARPNIDYPTLALQVALDRAGISPGLVDGRPGARTNEALAVFQRARGLPETNTLDPASRDALGPDTDKATRPYTITAEDVAGPFQKKIPDDLMSQGELETLAYTSIVELLAERFHTDERLLRLLNPKARFREGEVILVPDVEPMSVPAESKRRGVAGQSASRADAVVVSRFPALAMVVDTAGRLLFAAPVTSGSEHDPLPIGQWKVTDVYLLPVFHYNPALFWDADPSHARTSIKPGPNNPVGVAWIDIDREHYGLHGTPEPRAIGRSASHGCVRLTNWDVLRLLEFVKPGTRVVFSEQPPDLRSASDVSAVPAKKNGETDDDLTELRRRSLLVPVRDVPRAQLIPSFTQTRDGHVHEALDIPAPRGTPVLAVEAGSIAKLFKSKPGGLTVYQFDPSRRYAYYYAHLDRYAPGLSEGKLVERGDLLGYVGSTGNASPTQPHLHFAIFRLGPEQRWWQGVALDPYAVYMTSHDG